jgi:hypothetical protein
VARAFARFAPVLVLAAVAACGAEPGVEEGGSSSEAQTGAEGARHILFPGNPACGGPCESFLAGADLYVPRTNGRPWGDTYELGRKDADSAGGYSSGRIALLRRLALLPSGQRVAVLLDPSWPDGQRDFAGETTTGPEIVSRWLEGDADRRFVLVYSTQSTGWKEYAALQRAPLGARVRVCSVDAPHLQVPRAVGRKALVEPETWDNGTCSWGDGG